MKIGISSNDFSNFIKIQNNKSLETFDYYLNHKFPDTITILKYLSKIELFIGILKV